jgi:hypothetical protein
MESKDLLRFFFSKLYRFYFPQFILRFCNRPHLAFNTAVAPGSAATSPFTAAPGGEAWRGIVCHGVAWHGVALALTLTHQISIYKN